MPRINDDSQVTSEASYRGRSDIVLVSVSTDTLINELSRRGYAVQPKDDRPETAPQSEPNETPEMDWLQVGNFLQRADEAYTSALSATLTRAAVWQLYLLLEPPSVRERRRSQT
jgi:hypothetical protein